MTLYYGSIFSCKEELDAVYRVKAYSANKAGEWLHYWFKVVERLHKDMILGFD